MANINRFSSVSPDTYLKAGSDMALAKFGHLNVIVDAYNTLDTIVSNGTVGTVGTVTQATSITTGVTLNASKGVITTFSVTLAAGASSSAIFTLTNSSIKTTSVILTNCLQGATGSSVNALVNNILAGSCDILLTNVGGTTTGAATITIHFAIL